MFRRSWECWPLCGFPARSPRATGLNSFETTDFVRRPEDNNRLLGGDNILTVAVGLAAVGLAATTPIVIIPPHEQRTLPQARPVSCAGHGLWNSPEGDRPYMSPGTDSNR